MIVVRGVLSRVVFPVARVGVAHIRGPGIAEETVLYVDVIGTKDLADLRRVVLAQLGHAVRHPGDFVVEGVAAGLHHHILRFAAQADLHTLGKAARVRIAPVQRLFKGHEVLFLKELGRGVQRDRLHADHAFHL